MCLMTGDYKERMEEMLKGLSMKRERKTFDLMNQVWIIGEVV
jgi:hypothetical protein